MRCPPGLGLVRPILQLGLGVGDASVDGHVLVLKRILSRRNACRNGSGRRRRRSWHSIARFDARMRNHGSLRFYRDRRRRRSRGRRRRGRDLLLVIAHGLVRVVGFLVLFLRGSIRSQLILRRSSIVGLVFILHAGAWCKANPGPIAIAGSEAVLPWRRVGQLLLDIVLGLRTVGQAGVVGNGGRPVDQIVHTAEVVEGVDVPLLDAFSYRVHSLFEARGRIEPGLSSHGLHYSAVLCEQRHLKFESLPGHIVGKYRG